MRKKKDRIDAMAIVLEPNVIDLVNERQCVNTLMAAHFALPSARELRHAQARARELRAWHADYLAQET